MTPGRFADRLLDAVEAKRSHVVIGLDPDHELLPPQVQEAHRLKGYGSEAEMKAACYREFLTTLLESLCEVAVAVKPQAAYFEALGWPGYQLYEEVVGLAKEAGLLVIADVKRGDIGSTAEAYARAHLDVVGADAVTVNPYLGTDSLEPFLRRVEECGKGIFVLVKTSNPSSSDVQDAHLSGGGALYHRVADLVNTWGTATEGSHGYRSVGAVVGGTHAGLLAELRARMPRVPLLVPGYGAQGARAEDLAPLFDAQGTGAVVNSSRAILYAYRTHPGTTWWDAARREAHEMKTALWKAAGRG